MTLTGNSQFWKELQCFGPQHRLAYVRWAPSNAATQTLTEAVGVTSVTRSAAGAYTINFVHAAKAVIPLHRGEVENDATTYHFVRVESTDAANANAVVSHKSVVFASVASGPTGSDTVDELCFAFLLRVAN